MHVFNLFFPAHTATMMISTVLFFQSDADPVQKNLEHGIPGGDLGLT